MRSAYLGDGFDLHGTVKEVPGDPGHGQINFRFRLAKPSYQFQYTRLQYGLPDEEVNRILTDIIINHLQEITETDGKNPPQRLDLRPELVKDLWPDIQIGIAEHIVGLRKTVLQQTLGKSPTGSGSQGSTPNTTGNAPTASDSSTTKTDAST